MRRVWSGGLSFLFILLLFSACQKELSLENISLQARGSLDCSSIAVHGIWYNGVTPSDTNYVDVTVNVTEKGAYKVSTDLQNGVFLVDSGVFTNLGANTLRLRPSGVFFNHDPTAFTFSFDTTACSFTIDVQDSTGTGLGGPSVDLNTWKFTANGRVYSGPVIIASIISGLGNTTFVLNGELQSSQDTTFGISIKFPSSVDTNTYAGIYPTSTDGTNFLLTDASLNAIFAAYSGTPSQVININIVSYDNTTRIMNGTFSGNSSDSVGNTIPISSGAFSAQLQ